MISRNTIKSDAQSNGSRKADVDPAFLRQRLRDMAEGLIEAIDIEVETLRREGLPIYVYRDGKVVDLQQEESHNHPA